jgi:hypothetical protein
MAKARRTRFDDYIFKKAEEIDAGKNLKLIKIASRLRENVLNPYNFDSWSFVPHNETPVGANQLYRKLCSIFEEYPEEDWEKPDCKYIVSLIWKLNDRQMDEETYTYYDNLSIDALRLKFTMNPNWRYRKGGRE